MILRILKAEVRGPYRLWLSFNDGTRAEVDVRPLLSGPVFEQLREPSYFAQATLDPICGTMVWPNGADFAPEALKALIGLSPDEARPRGQLTAEQQAELIRRDAELDDNPEIALTWEQIRASVERKS